MFIAALFKVASKLEQHKCLLMDECISKMPNIYTTEYYSAIRNNGLLTYGDICYHIDEP
jgi:hypothetical protein